MTKDQLPPDMQADIRPPRDRPGRGLEREPGDWDREQQRVEEARLEAARIFRRFWDRSASIHRPNRHWTAWLLVRYAAMDLGLRPIPPGSAFWASPDIWVESSDPIGQPVAGTPNIVHARIFNLGMANAAPVRVDFYWANPSLGLGPANMNLIGSEWVEVTSQTSREVRCSAPWIPVFVNGGHECLMVNCSNHVLDPIRHPFQPLLDRHVGQRNLHVVEVPTGSALTFPLDVNNVFPLRTTAVVTAHMHHMVVKDPRWLKRGDQDLLHRIVGFGTQAADSVDELRRRFRPDMAEWLTANRVADVAAARSSYPDEPAVAAIREHRGAVQLTARWTGHSAVAVPEEPGRVFGALLMGTGSLATSHDQPAGLPIERIDMRPFEQRRLEMEIVMPGDAEPGEVVTCHLTQWEEGFPVGGYTVVMNVE